MFTANERIGEGAHGSVYKGTNSLGRPVAIKFITESVGDREFVLNQAKAIARAESRHVVSVIDVEDVLHPESGQLTPAIVMEWLDGCIFRNYVRDAPDLTLEMVRRIGFGIITGMKSIHEAGVVHTDLHPENIMICEGNVPKILDILYRSTLAQYTTASRQRRIQDDSNDIRSVLTSLLTRFSFTASEAFNAALPQSPTLDQIHEAFAEATTSTKRSHIDELVNRVFDKIDDVGFVATPEYAAALFEEEIDDCVVRPLIDRMMASESVRDVHVCLLEILWTQLPLTDRRPVVRNLAAAIHRTVPAGNFRPHLCTLVAFGKTGWDMLPKATKIRLEKLITEDILNGRYDVSTRRLKSGGIGVFAAVLYSCFENRSEVIDNMIQRLESGLEGQDYIGMYFMASIANIAASHEDMMRLTYALTIAANFGSTAIQYGITTLPEIWRQQIHVEPLS